MIIVQTPLRVSIIGGGTDLPEWYKFYGGCVVGSSIDKYTYVIVKKRFDDKICAGYSKLEVVDHIKDLQHDLIRIAADFTGLEKGFEVKLMADIPSGGSGLGSSSSYMVGLLTAFWALKGKSFPAEDTASEAYFLERELLKKTVGIQDHYLTALGGNYKLFINKDGSVYPRRTFIDDRNLFLHFTGIVREAELILKNQVNLIGNKHETYSEMQQLAKNFTNDLLSESIGLSWLLKSSLQENISNPDIEKMITMSKSAGATNCKILGAGGGGFLLSYVEPERHETFLQVMSQYRRLPFQFTEYGTRIIFNNENT